MTRDAFDNLTIAHPFAATGLLFVLGCAGVLVLGTALYALDNLIRRKLAIRRRLDWGR